MQTSRNRTVFKLQPRELALNQKHFADVRNALDCSEGVMALIPHLARDAEHCAFSRGQERWCSYDLAAAGPSSVPDMA
eukprot:1218897-Rhodomonas_salina.1